MIYFIMNKSGILALPNELLAEIGYFLETGSEMKTFRLVSKSINEALQRVLWSTRALVINLNRQQLSLEMDKLEDLAQGCSASQYIRFLRIKSVNPNQPLFWMEERPYEDNEEDDFVFHNEEEFVVVGPEPAETEKMVADAKERLISVLPAALLALKGLRYASLRIAGEDHDAAYTSWFVQGVIKPLSSHPLLKDLVLVTYPNLSPPTLLPLQDFRHLEKLYILGDWCIWNEHTLSSLSATLFNNPNLIRLKLCTLPDNASFDRLFPEITSQPLQLRDLHLNGWHILLSAPVIPHLQSLRTLELPDMLSESYANIWRPLRSSSIHLLEITLYSINNDFLDYLNSYSGLQVLKISIAGIGAPETDELGKRFFAETLPRHSETLRTLHFATVLEDEWTISLKNVKVFDKCKNLVFLCVGLKASEIHPGGTAEKDVVHSLIARLAQLPSLDVVTFISPPAFLDVIQMSRRGVERQMEMVRRKTVESIEEIRIPKSSVPYPVPMFVVATLTPNAHYLVESEDEDGVLVFVREEGEGDDSFYFTDIDHELEYMSSPSWD
ncbi:hypothetical protein L218DRAFT_931969 [Marasmius fiardii PR-910]|nr:hypothetical protein L218DRAFT_931969 [Marasmius fiardii PR-910]